MCSQYTLKAQAKLLADIYHTDVDKSFEEIIDMQIFPYKPGIVFKDGELAKLNYSLVPSWSKERRVKFATYNARIEDIETKPTWKGPFIDRHCVVPITAFIEPIYEGEWGGNMVAFGKEKILHAAGIWDRWKDATTGEVVESYAILTSPPYPFIAKAGHDRSPIFIKESAIHEWVSLQSKDPKEIKQFLRDHWESLDNFSVTKVRALKTPVTP
ncbi:SOS response-associated peptidase family protein [Bdellovibrio bacteriovorus]